ncbi:hypothetical protein OAO18_05535, partial [Francisellaceae bacterium]|nr:hypothetical protein [Francisellaceae bacterium]
MKLKKLVSLVSIISYSSVFLVDPVYSAMKIESRDDTRVEQNGSDGESSDALSTATLNNMLALANSGGDSFQSQAGDSGLPASIAVNPEKLQVEFSEKIATLSSNAMGNFSFALMVNNMKPSQALGSVISNVDLSLNLPYVKYIKTKNSIDYYELMINNNKLFFKVAKDENGNRQVSFSYQKKKNFELTFEDDTHIKFVSQDGSTFLFEKSKDDNLSYLYPVTDLISNQGSKFSFDYRSATRYTGVLSSSEDLDGRYKNYEGFDIKNNDGQVIATTGKLSDNIYLVTYKDFTGTNQTFRISRSGSEISLVNPIGDAIKLNLNDNLITQVLFPNGVTYDANYKEINTVDYLIDGKSAAVKQNASYVTGFTKHLHNQYSTDQQYNYSLSTDSHNYLGNHIGCSESTMNNLDS